MLRMVSTMPSSRIDTACNPSLFQHANGAAEYEAVSRESAGRDDMASTR